MNFWKLDIVLFIIFGLASGRQFCGSDLADVMQLVCNGRGYNVAFTSDLNPKGEKRFKRGIVDECCRRGCSWSTLETYCSPNPPSVQIRKRSDFSSKWQPDSSETHTNIEMFKYETNQLKSEDKISFKNMPPYLDQLISVWDENDRHSQPPRSHTLVNKVKRNDINEETKMKSERRVSLSFPINWRDLKMDIGKRGNQIGDVASSLPIRLRHRKSKITKESSNSQVGTVPPYFLGRTLVLPPSSRKL